MASPEEEKESRMTPEYAAVFYKIENGSTLVKCDVYAWSGDADFWRELAAQDGYLSRTTKDYADGCGGKWVMRPTMRSVGDRGYEQLLGILDRLTRKNT